MCADCIIILLSGPGRFWLTTLANGVECLLDRVHMHIHTYMHRCMWLYEWLPTKAVRFIVPLGDAFAAPFSQCVFLPSNVALLFVATFLRAGDFFSK